MHKYSHINLTNLNDFILKESQEDKCLNNQSHRLGNKINVILKVKGDSSNIKSYDTIAFVKVEKFAVNLYISSNLKLFDLARDFVEEKLSEEEFYSFVSKAMFVYIQENGSLLDFHKEVIESLKEKSYCDGFNSKRVEILNLLTTEMVV